MKKDAPYFEAVFHSDMARRFVDNGYGIRRTDRDFELAGVPERLIKVYSKRSEQINQEAKESHRTLAIEAAKVVERTGMDFEDAFAQEKARLGAKTRAAKSSETIGPTERRAHWLTQMTPEQRRAMSVEAVKSAPSQNLLHQDEAERLAIDHAFSRVSLVRPLRLMGEILKKGIGVLSRQDAESSITEFSRCSVVPIGQMVSTKTVIEEEVVSGNARPPSRSRI